MLQSEDFWFEFDGTSFSKEPSFLEEKMVNYYFADVILYAILEVKARYWRDFDTAD